MIITASTDAATETINVYENRCWVQIGSSNSFINAGPKTPYVSTFNVLLNAVYGTSVSFATLAAVTTALVAF